jgi:hypothetical protein
MFRGNPNLLILLSDALERSFSGAQPRRDIVGRRPRSIAKATMYVMVGPHPGFRSLVISVLAAFFSLTTGCAHTIVRWNGTPTLTTPVNGPIVVLVSPGPALPPENARFAARLLELVREEDPTADLAYGTEASPSRTASQRGARFVLEVKVLRWRDAETQYSGEPDSIRLLFRLIQLQPQAVVREMQFESRSWAIALTNAPADRLLNRKFRKAVRQFLGSVRH